MPLPLQAVDRLVERLHVTYGGEWVRKWEGLEPAAVKTLWAAELEPFSDSLHRIAWALQNLPERCPNAIEFKRLCYQAPAPEEKLLPAPAANPERVKAELAKLGGLRPQAAQGNLDHMKDWARRLIARHEAGEKLRPIQLRFAREALGLPLYNK